MNAPHASESPSSDSAIAAHREKNPYLAFASRTGLGLVVVAFLLWHFDAHPVLSILTHEHPAYFAATIIIYVAGQVMSAWRWQLLAAIVGVHARFREFLAYYFIGMFTNLFVPGMLGGDAARSVYLGRRTHHLGEAIASVVADRGTGLIALFWVAAVMALAIPRALAPSVIRTTVIVGAVALVLFFAARVIALAVRYLPRSVRRAMGMVLPYMHRPQSTIPALFLSAVLQLSLGFGQWLLARGLGMTQPLSLFLLCVPIANLFAGLPITLNGLGVRESAFLVLFGMAGMNRNDAIALGLLWFAATMLGGLTGAIAFALTKFPDGKHQHQSSGAS